MLSVPINASRQKTYENAAVNDDAQRFAHFSAGDHKCYYGLDFSDRLAEADFHPMDFRVPPDDEVRHALLRDEWLTIPRKPDDS